jgi:hypothetical protein
LGSRTAHGNVREAHSLNLLLKPRSSTLHGLYKSDVHIRPSYSNDQAGQAASGSHVDHVSWFENLGQHAAVEDVARPDAFGFARPDESALLTEFCECPRELSNLVES